MQSLKYPKPIELSRIVLGIVFLLFFLPSSAQKVFDIDVSDNADVNGWNTSQGVFYQDLFAGPFDFATRVPEQKETVFSVYNITYSDMPYRWYVAYQHISDIAGKPEIGSLGCWDSIKIIPQAGESFLFSTPCYEEPITPEEMADKIYAYRKAVLCTWKKGNFTYTLMWSYVDFYLRVSSNASPYFNIKY